METTSGRKASQAIFRKIPIATPARVTVEIQYIIYWKYLWFCLKRFQSFSNQNTWKETDILFQTKTYYYKFIHIYQFYKRSLSSISITPYCKGFYSKLAM